MEIARRDILRAIGVGIVAACRKSSPDPYAPFTDLLTSFIAEQRIPGASLAVSRAGAIIYARGFGFADREAGQGVEPTSRFRVASVTKPITSAAVMQLVEAGKLALDARVVDVLALDAPNWRDITIAHLLQHRAGFDKDHSFDPMFHIDRVAAALGVAEVGHAELIRYMIAQPLAYAPGTRYVYANFDYCLLGRVIEKLAGTSYGEHVGKHVLAPLGITDMQLGNSRFADRAPREVRYYGNAYGAWPLELMDSHGGWIATASDLLQFAHALDGPSPVLDASAIRTTFARPPGETGEVWYGCGWQVRDAGNGMINTWHTGSLDGTSALLVRRWDRLAWAVLFNTRGTPSGQEPAALIDPLLHRAADTVAW